MHELADLGLELEGAGLGVELREGQFEGAREVAAGLGVRDRQVDDLEGKAWDK